MTNKYYSVLLKAVQHFGEESQLMVAVEEMSELTKEISKHYRGEHNLEALSEEMADVYIMLWQMLIMFDNEDEVKKWIDKKVLRLEKRLNKGMKYEETIRETKYCDRNICASNEYNSIGCDKCEVTKSRESEKGSDKEYAEWLPQYEGKWVQASPTDSEEAEE